MTTSGKNDRDLAALHEDIAVLKRGVASLMEHLQAGATSSVQSATGRLEATARQLYKDAAAEVGRPAKAIGRRVEEQPLTALLIALGIGYVSGRLLSR